MRLKLFLIALLSAVLQISAQTANLNGLVVNSASGNPVNGAQVSLQKAAASTFTSFNGDFQLKSTPGSDIIIITADGFESL